MSDDEADPELLALLAQSLAPGPKPEAPPTTRVLETVQYVYDNALDVSISSAGTKAAAGLLLEQLKQRQYSTYDWSKHELHPKPSGGEATADFIFTMNLLNFSFWSSLPENERFAVEYKGKRWTGYWSLCAALQRGLDEGYAITTPASWSTLTDADFTYIFRSATAEPMPLLSTRITLLREAAHLCPADLITSASQSAASLVNLLTSTLPLHFDDTTTYQSKRIHFHKRAQILVADLWACFRGEGLGQFDDIDTALTMFADYRVPQMLQRLGVLWYSPRLEGRIRRGEVMKYGEPLEVEIRGCCVWAVEMLRREIVRRGGGEWEAEVEVEVEAEAQAQSRASEQKTIPDVPMEIDHPQIHTNGTSIGPDSEPMQTTQVEDAIPTSSTTNLPTINTILTPEQPAPMETPSTNPSTKSLTPTLSTAPTSNPSPTSPRPTSSSSPTTHTKTIRVTLNAVLLDYLLYDTAKEVEARDLAEQAAATEHDEANGPRGDVGGSMGGEKSLPHHRVRSIWY